MGGLIQIAKLGDGVRSAPNEIPNNIQSVDPEDLILLESGGKAPALKPPGLSIFIADTMMNNWVGRGRGRANLARRQRGSRKVFLMTLSLALGALAIGGNLRAGAQCSGEAKVSVERYGPNCSIAEDSPAIGRVRLTNRA